MKRTPRLCILVFVSLFAFESTAQPNGPGDHWLVNYLKDNMGLVTSCLAVGATIGAGLMWVVMRSRAQAQDEQPGDKVVKGAVAATTAVVSAVSSTLTQAPPPPVENAAVGDTPLVSQPVVVARSPHEEWEQRTKGQGSSTPALRRRKTDTDKDKSIPPPSAVPSVSAGELYAKKRGSFRVVAEMPVAKLKKLISSYAQNIDPNFRVPIVEDICALMKAMSEDDLAQAAAETDSFWINMLGGDHGDVVFAKWTLRQLEVVLKSFGKTVALIKDKPVFDDADPDEVMQRLRAIASAILHAEDAQALYADSDELDAKLELLELTKRRYLAGLDKETREKVQGWMDKISDLKKDDTRIGKFKTLVSELKSNFSPEFREPLRKQISALLAEMSEEELHTVATDTHTFWIRMLGTSGADGRIILAKLTKKHLAAILASFTKVTKKVKADPAPGEENQTPRVVTVVKEASAEEMHERLAAMSMALSNAKAVHEQQGNLDECEAKLALWEGAKAAYLGSLGEKERGELESGMQAVIVELTAAISKQRETSEELQRLIDKK